MSMLKQVQRLTAAIQRAPLLACALLLILVKSIQFMIDSQALFWYDSGAFILNALGEFIPDRSYVYGGLIRAFAVPFHSLPAIVGMQVIMGGLTAWCLAFVLVRFLQVRSWIAIGVALVFAFDPVQIVYEHMVMTEAAALLAMAVFLLAALKYLGDPSMWRLVILSFLGALLVGLRLVYLPVVLAAAVLLPLATYFSSSTRRARLLALALVASCGSTALFQQGYRYLTGWLAAREPAYHFKTGLFLLATVAPLVKSADIGDVRVAGAVAAQNRSAFPLSNPDNRSHQLWDREGLVAKLKTSFAVEAAHAARRDRIALQPIGLFYEQEADQAARHLAYAAILRDPLGFLRLGFHSYLSYWRGIGDLWWKLPSEDGALPPPTVAAREARVISSVFGADVSNQQTLNTPSRRYHVFARNWCVFLLASPLLAGLAWWLTSANSKGLALLFVWNCLLLAATCLGSQELDYRYLHPFSFTGLAATAILFEKLAESAWHYDSNWGIGAPASKINLGRMLLGGIVAGIVIDLIEGALNSFLQQVRWAGVMTGLGRSISVKQMIAFNAWGLAAGILLVWLYAAIRPRFGAGPKTALLAGAMVWFFVDGLGLARPVFLHIHQAGTTVAAVAFELVGILIAGLLGAYVYREDGASLRQPAMQAEE